MYTDLRLGIVHHCVKFQVNRVKTVDRSARTDGRTDERTDERTNRKYLSIGLASRAYDPKTDIFCLSGVHSEPELQKSELIVSSHT